MSSTDSLRNFIAENRIADLSATEDQVYRYDAEEHAQAVRAKPWQLDPHHFNHVKISAVALVKMVSHARSGGDLEIMGLLQGKIHGRTMLVMDVFALPVEGTETRVNAHEQAYEYMVQYTTKAKEVGRLENVIGWYHSHPGYGCWLSGIDVGTQMANQQFQEPWLAIVVDPKRTMSAGKVDLGAFRTFPQGYAPTAATAVSEFQPIPTEKVEDFGVHASKYYQLKVSYFKSSLDKALLNTLWNKYWADTLAQSPLVTNRDFLAARITDFSHKVAKTCSVPASNTRPRNTKSESGSASESLTTQAKLDNENSMICCELVQGALSQVMKQVLFN
ncbi:COP9 signalosome catalytic subunit rri1 [Tieghemiomyces parasiticus]|uniref:COP9 signalosome complex subunit 5 n=1 Tax=Tieghemiomyces parasiticus TaxID=78921 RepID=A0A9W8AEM2_9FUNG|nr:COP9 signalosome catalytic subunit rri1 [Tieghemiomyces parasiticus]